MWRLSYESPAGWKLPEYRWGEERKTCQACAHYSEVEGGVKTRDVTMVMVCGLSNRNGGRNHGTCFEMRYDGECGRSAKLFAPKGGGKA